MNDISGYNPYVGPRFFERNELDRARFFGRDREMEEIVSFILGHPLVLVYAQSGAGKTSLFNAKIIPTLEDEHTFEVLPLARVQGVIPEGLSGGEIANLYAYNILQSIASKEDPRTLVQKTIPDFLKDLPRGYDAKEGRPVPRALIFDQFEEIFSLYPKGWQEKRDNLFHQIRQALDSDPLLRIVLIIREDYLPQLDPFAHMLPEGWRIRFRLERLRQNQALEAIVKPLTNTQYKFGEGAAESLVKELSKIRTMDPAEEGWVEGLYVEPVQLQVVCMNLWSNRRYGTREISIDDIRKLDVDQALAEFYEDAIHAAVKDQGVNEFKLRTWFEMTLITSMGTRGTVLKEKEVTGGIANTAVEFLERKHLIRAEYRSGASWYELTHDRFIEPIRTSNTIWRSEQTRAQVEKAKETILRLTSNYLGIEFVLIPNGSFVMGSSEGYDNEKPPHSVKISEPFYLQTTEVTQLQWKKVMGENPSEFNQCGDDCPVENVSWNDAQRFIEKLNQIENTKAYRLPSEAEWEYACRAGTTTEYSFGNDDSKLGEYAWYDYNSKGATQRIATKKPNPFGLYDMHGNVWEWVEDDWHDSYEGAPAEGLAWVDKPRGSERVQRGGGWSSDNQDCRSAMRLGDRTATRGRRVGFRLARSITFGP